MGEILLDLLLLNVIAVICIDKLQIYRPLKHLAWRLAMGKLPYREYRLRPFDCALCTGWWLGLGYMLICVRPLTLWHIVLPLLFAYANHIIGSVLTLIEVLLNKIYEKLI